MFLALASALAAQQVQPQPEARAIEQAQREIEALWGSGAHIIVRTTTPGRRDALRRAIRAVRHPRHCISEIDVRVLETPVGVQYANPQRFDWSALDSSGLPQGNRVSFRYRTGPWPMVNGRPVRPDRSPVEYYFEAPDEASARRLALAARALIEACKPN